MPGKGDILTSGRFLFPKDQIFNIQDYQESLEQPIQISIKEILLDLFKYTKDFPAKLIPHVTSQEEVIDMIHNYKRKRQNNKADDKDAMNPNLPFGAERNKNASAIDSTRPNLKEEDINKALKEIYCDRTARLVGLVAHICYWSVFTHFNQLPLDDYHKKQLFVNIAQIQQ